MASRSRVITRRDFVRVGGGLAAVGLLGGGRRHAEGQEPPARSRVVLIRRQDALDAAGAPDGAVLHEMLNEAVAALLEIAGPAAAWKRLIRPGDVVGIKSNVWRNLATPPALEEAERPLRVLHLEVERAHTVRVLAQPPPGPAALAPRLDADDHAVAGHEGDRLLPPRLRQLLGARPDLGEVHDLGVEAPAALEVVDER